MTTGAMAAMAAGYIALFAAMPVIMNMGPKWFVAFQEWMSVSSTSINTKNILKELAEALDEALVGQEYPKMQILSAVAGYLEAKDNPHAKSGSLILHLAGISGSGKSVAVDVIKRVLLGESAESIKISYSSIDSSIKNSRSVVDQLLGQTEGNYGGIKVDKNTKLAAQLIHNPKTVIEIHELDKLMQKDDSMQAWLWDMADEGRTYINGKPVDCRDTIVLITSNSSKGSVGLGVDDEDPTKSLTKIDFKQMFLNRIPTIYFGDFMLEEYVKITCQKLEAVVKYYKEKFSLEINISDETVSKIAAELKDKKTGGVRNIKPYLNKIYTNLAEFRREKDITESTKHSEPLNIILEYDETVSDFIIK